MKTRWDGWVIALVAGAVYVATAPRWIIGGDNAELVTIFARGGVAHPPGYPLYEMILRAFAWLPVAAPFASALVTAAIGAAAIVVLHAAALAWGASRPAAAIATAVFAGTRLAWMLSSSAEVFALNVLLACALVLVSGPEATTRGWHRALALGLFFGLGLSNHHTIIFLAPLAFWGLLVALREDAGPKWRPFAAGAAGLAVGLSPYAYLLWQGTHADPATAWVWGNVHDLPSLFRHFRRAEYGTTRLALADAPREPWPQIRTLLTSSITELLALPAIAFLGGVVSLRKPKAGVVMLSASAILAGPIFVTAFNIPPRGLSLAIVERFHLLPFTLVAVLAAIAIDVVIPRLPERPTIGFAIAAIAIVAQFVIAAPAVAESHRPTIDHYVRNTLESAPPNTIIVGSGDEKFAGFMYGRKVLGLRTDVEFITPEMLYADWARERVSATLGITLAVPTSDRVALVEQLAATGRPVGFVGTVPQAIYAHAIDTYPHGTLQMLVRKGDPTRDVDTLERQNLQLLQAFVLEPTSSESRDTWSGSTFAEYARSWVILENAFRSQGRTARADDCHKRAIAFAPWLH